MDLRGRLPVVGVVAAGGALGAVARYAASLAWPTATDAFPWTTFAVNVSGCALLGVLMVLLTETMTAPHPLLRPFLGTGFCGGYTTFSTYGLDTQRLLATGETVRAVLYLGGTAVTALAAVWAGVTAARTVAARTGERGAR
ncbi:MULTISPECIES: fluoride efflux transporter CrcB [unclassified Streptomyces]|uniref:fluoride efflux transporter CrcB n=1 Tax=unclassified Streptomyces TaxID=2593676 RepID=UPI00344C195D